MSRISLHRPRRHRAVCHRPATDTRLPLSPIPPTILHLTNHYKRCPKAQRLRLRSDLSPSRPLHGRSPDKSWHALTSGYCQVRASLTRRTLLASSGDALEHSVMSLPWAIAPFSDSPGLDLAGESEQLDNLRLKTNAPFKDSTVVTNRELRSTNGGHGSTLPSLGVVERFWWTRLPHSEISSLLLHVPSEVRGCRRVVANVEHPLRRTKRIGTGVDAFSRNRPGSSITLPSPTHNPTYPSPTIGGRPCLEEAAGPAPAHPKETTTLSSTAGTPAACGNSPPSSPSSPVPAALPRVTPRKPGSLPPSHSPPSWTAFPSTLCSSPTPPCKTSIAPSKPFNPPNLSGQGNSQLLAQTKPKTPRNLKVFPKTIRIHAWVRTSIKNPHPPAPLAPSSPHPR